MGIHYYFKWMKNTFPTHIKTVQLRDGKLAPYGEPINTDNFLIDMNGIIHQCCQLKYQYGSFKAPKSLLHPNRKPMLPKTVDVFQEVCEYVDELVSFVDPKKRLFLAIDGPAPIAKQLQQRSRRARASVENSESNFDTCSITPGTVFLDGLSSYMDRHIHKKNFRRFVEHGSDF
jgi:5'-3' exonuclease